MTNAARALAKVAAKRFAAAHEVFSLFHFSKRPICGDARILCLGRRIPKPRLAERSWGRACVHLRASSPSGTRTCRRDAALVVSCLCYWTRASCPNVHGERGGACTCKYPMGLGLGRRLCGPPAMSQQIPNISIHHECGSVKGRIEVFLAHVHRVPIRA